MFPLQQVYGCMAKKATNMLCIQLLAFLKLKMVLFRGLEARLNGRPLAQHACNPEVWYPAPHRHTRCFFNGIENPLALSIYTLYVFKPFIDKYSYYIQFLTVKNALLNISVFLVIHESFSKVFIKKRDYSVIVYVHFHPCQILPQE